MANKESNSITGEHLLHLLQKLTPEQLRRPIHGSHEFGDYWHSIAGPALGGVSEGKAIWNERMQQFEILTDKQLEKAEQRQAEGIEELEEGDEMPDDELWYNNQKVIDILIID